MTITKTKRGFKITRALCIVCGESPFGNEYCCGHDQYSERDNLIALINTYNEASSPSVPRTDAEHQVERDRARMALRSIKRNYTVDERKRLMRRQLEEWEQSRIYYRQLKRKYSGKV